MTAAYRLVARSESPLHLAAQRARGGESATLSYVPGAAVRGAVAAAYLDSSGGTTPAFRRLMDGCAFGNLYPVRDPARQSAPAPRSLFTCAHHPGLRADGGHGASDTLILAEAARLANERGADEPRQPLLRCAQCAAAGGRATVQAVVPLAGCIEWTDDVPLGSAPARDATIQRPAGGRSAFVAYRQTLATGQCFVGVLTGLDAELLLVLEQTLAAQERQVWVGSGRSRGLGALRLQALEPISPPDDLAARQAALTQALGQACARRGTYLDDGEQYVALTLAAPALLRDPFGRWRLSLGAASLASQLGLPADALELRQASVATTAVEGWNAALDQPKADAVSLAVGSVWLLRVRGGALDQALAALDTLERRGLGERRQEGFGAVRVCDPVHWQVQQLEGESVA